MINEEEKQFLKTLSHGRRVFERTVEKMHPSVSVIPGEGREVGRERERERGGGREREEEGREEEGRGREREEERREEEGRGREREEEGRGRERERERKKGRE